MRKQIRWRCKIYSWEHGWRFAFLRGLFVQKGRGGGVVKVESGKLGYI